MKKDAQYEILRKVGEGAYGVVYLARDRHLDRKVALKVFKFGPAGHQALERFRREALLLTQHPHECLVPVLDAKLDHQPPYMVFRWMPGGDLKQRIRAEGAAPTREVASVGARVARALEHLHERDILHRDVKPANVLLDADGEAFLADLGLGLATEDPRLTATQAVVGTPNYMAREVLEGEGYSPSSDVFSLGACLLELTLGRVFPELHSDVQVTQTRLREVRDRALRTLLRRCLASSPERRPESARALAEELEAIAARDSRASALPPPKGGNTLELSNVLSASERTSQRIRPYARSPWPWVAAQALGLGALALLAGTALRALGDQLVGPPRWPPYAAADTPGISWTPPPLGPPVRPADALRIDDRGRLLAGDTLASTADDGRRALAVRGDGAGTLYAVLLGPEGSLALDVRPAEDPTRTVRLHEHRAPAGGRLELTALLVDPGGGFLLVDAEDPGHDARYRTGVLWDAQGRFLWSRTHRGEGAGEALRLLALRPDALLLAAGGELLRVEREGGVVRRFATPGLPEPLSVSHRREGLLVRDAAARVWVLP